MVEIICRTAVGGRGMARERLVADLLQELLLAKKNGAVYFTVKEQSEDMARLYFRKGELYHVRYGSAAGRDCLDILHYYTLTSASFFEGIIAVDAPAKGLPPTDAIIAWFRRTGQIVKVQGEEPGME
jgi:hypothetical protein